MRPGACPQYERQVGIASDTHDWVGFVSRKGEDTVKFMMAVSLSVLLAILSGKVSVKFALWCFP